MIRTSDGVFVQWLTALLFRYSSMVPNSRNPVWGEEFDFYAEELPVQVHEFKYEMKECCGGSVRNRMRVVCCPFFRIILVI